MLLRVRAPLKIFIYLDVRSKSNISESIGRSLRFTERSDYLNIELQLELNVVSKLNISVQGLHVHKLFDFQLTVR